MNSSTVNFLSQRISTAVASYGLLLRNDWQSRLTAPDGPVKFTDTQAAIFISQYDLVDQQQNVDYNGFSATVFRDKAGHAVIAMRGTESNSFSQVIFDLTATDGLSIGGNGFANTQAVEMMRYYRRLTTAGGQAVQYSITQQWQMFAISNSLLVPLALISPTLTAVLAAKFALFQAELAKDKGVVPPAGSPSASVLSPDEKVDVTGHSLGGHLALLFARLFPNNTDEVVTLNAPGLFPQGDYALASFGFPKTNESNITRIEADGDPVSEIGTVWPGYRLRIAQENNSEAAAVLDNHSSSKGNDALSLMALMAKLDTQKANDAVGLSQLLRGSANTAAPTYENALDSIRRALLGDTTVDTEVSFGEKDPKRKNLYDNMDTLAKSVAFVALAGKVQLTAASSSLGNSARNDFAALLALKTLSPIALKAVAGSDSAVETVLANANNLSYVDWLADKNLTPAQRGKGLENYSDTWMRDRGAMLGAVVSKNIGNEAYATTNSTLGLNSSSTYSDANSAITLNSGDPAAAGGLAKVAFGGDKVDAITGGTRDDHLYGGAGNDTLSGGAGSDYLEGNADNDTLNGDDGGDMLVGGAGNDILNGGKGNDTLIGGNGNDVYNFDAEFGNDTIVDADALGVLQFGGAPLPEGRAVQGLDNAWEDAQREYVFTLAAGSAGSNDLIIGKRASPGATKVVGTITVRGWQQGQLGISLSQTKLDTTPTTKTFVGGYIKKVKDDKVTYVIGTDTNYVSDGADPTSDDILAGGATADKISGGAGNDLLLAGPGDDELDGGEGSDVILGGSGSDRISGGAGDDFIEGSGWPQGWYGPARVDTPAPVATGVELARGFGWVAYLSPSTSGSGKDLIVTPFTAQVANDSPNYIDAGAGNDYVTAGTGNDVVWGGDGNDQVDGMAGADVIFGGDGDDKLFGDGTIDPNYLGYTAAVNHGDDVLIGGNGNDTIYGQGGNDHLYGGAGNDLLFGDDQATLGTFGPVPEAFHGTDYIDGGDGDDRIVGGGNDDEIDGGAGDDYIWADDDRSQLPGAANGNDTVRGGAGNDTIIGGGGNDQISGGDGNDTLDGDADVEYLDAVYNGNDTIDGGAGDDVIDGGGGDDLIFGGDGIDMIAGGEGNDQISGGASNDTIDGQAGNDVIDGGEGSDSVSGGGGDDVLTGGDGNDYVGGGDGNDILIGGAGADTLNGGAGDDVFRIAVGESSDGTFVDTLISNEGTDRLELSGVSSNSITAVANSSGGINLAWGTLSGVAISNGATASISTISTSDGSTSYRELIGQRLLTKVIATSASDNGQLLGGAIADRLSTNFASTLVSGGRGNDDISLYSAAGAVVAMSVGDGTDHIDATERSSSPNAAATLLSPDFSASASATASAPINILRLDAGFVAGALKLWVGSNWNEYVLALNDLGDGVRFETPGTLPQLTPRNGPFDRVDFADGTSLSWQQILDRGVGAAPAATEGDDNFSLTPIDDIFLAGGGNDRIDGGAGNDRIGGGLGNDVLLGGADIDSLSGGVGNDQLFGGSGNDTLYGDEGDDVLNGDSGDDSLFGGDGTNQLFGGDGNDRLVSNTSGAWDNAEGGEGNDTYSIAFGDFVSINATARDTSLTSDDTYVAVATKPSNNSGGQVWSIDDNGGYDELQLPARLSDVVFRARGTGISLSAGTLDIYIKNCVTDTGAVGIGAIETVKLANGTVLTLQQLIAACLKSTPGPDVITGFGGNDFIDGGSGDDIIDGSGGYDTIDGSDGADTLRGGDGDDLLRGGAGFDILDGGTGDDRLEAGPGGGRLIGGTGNDTYVVRVGDGDVQVGSFTRGDLNDDGSDTLRIDTLSGAVTVSLEAISAGSDDDQIVIRFKDGSAVARILVQGTQSSPSTAVESILFSDNTTLNVPALILAALPSATANADTANLTGADDVYNGFAGNDLVYGRGGNDNLKGEAGDDQLYGGAGDDILDGGGGDDTLYSGSGRNKVLFGIGSGIDLVPAQFSAVNSLLFGPGVSPSSIGGSWSSAIFVSAFTQWESGDYDRQSTTWWGAQLKLQVGTQGDSVTFGITNWIDHYWSRAGTNSEFGIQEARFDNGIVWSLEDLVGLANKVTVGDDVLVDVLEKNALSGGSGNDLIYGLSGPNVLQGNDGDDHIIGGDDDDLLISGGDGNDILEGGNGSDVLDGGAGDDDLSPRRRNPVQQGVPAANSISDVDTLIGGSGNDILRSGNRETNFRFGSGFGNDLIKFQEARNGLAGRVVFESQISPSDVRISRSERGLVLSLKSSSDTIQVERFFLSSSSAALDSDCPVDQVQFADGTTWFANDLVARLVQVGTLTDDLILGTPGSDVIRGLAGNDIVRAGDGDDIVAGGIGRDRLEGGAGNDTYEYARGDGDDAIYDIAGSNDSLQFGPGITVEEVRVYKATLDGPSGVLPGFGLVLKNSVGILEVAGLDVVKFANGTTWDAVQLEALSRIVEGSDGNDFLLSGTSGPDILLGLAGNDGLDGLAGDDRLDGGTGADSMKGGLGNDTYVVDNVGDLTIEVSGEGVDTVESSISWTLAADVENLTLTGANATNGAGNGLSNTIIGNAAANRLDGAGGADSMSGGAGNDIYVVDNAGDATLEAAGGGTDSVESSISWSLSTEVENLTLTGTAAINGTGNTANNVITGNAAYNRLDGGAGADVMTGGAGNDTYVVDNSGDTTVEVTGGGIDSVEASINWTLATEVENLTLTGTTAINGTGNSLANTLRGNSAANLLDGGAGNDTLIGGAGDDVYKVDSISDVVTELAGEGRDRVESLVTLTLGANVEDLTLLGTAAINATGNTANNTLTGNGAANRLDGGAGADTIIGGSGNDTYVVDNIGDVVTELAAGGTDTVESSISWTLSAEVENLTLTGTSAINGIGNSLANILLGNAGANRLDGGTGADAMTGGAGNDTYVVDNVADTTVEVAGGGTDTVESSISWTLGAEVENLTLTGAAAINATGNAASNTLQGNAANNVIDGGAGADTMTGGAGDDVYKVDVATDVVTEAANAGRDRIETTVTLTLAANVEDLTLLGTSAINGTGNTLDNMLVGNSAANTLTGGAGNDSLNGMAGADTLVGGAGNDTYFVDNTADITTEAANEGTDTVNATLAWTLGNNLENLTLLGTTAINGTGNTLANVLTGNSAINVLTGLAGNDTLDGGAGADTLVGGTGNDTYVFGRGYGADLIQENDATAGNTDVVQFLSTITSDQIWFRKVGNDLEVSVIGTTDKATVQNWYLGNQYHTEQFKTLDGKTLLDTKVQTLVNAMAAFTPPAVGQTTLPANYQTTLAPVIVANWGP
jgi:trimeric autotransporter adhesin